MWGRVLNKYHVTDGPNLAANCDSRSLIFLNGYLFWD